MQTRSEEPQRFYRSLSPGLEARILSGYGLTRCVPSYPPAPVGNAAETRPLFSRLLLRLLAQINRRFLLRLAYPYREDNRPGVEGDNPSWLFEHNPRSSTFLSKPMVLALGDPSRGYKDTC